METCPSCKEFTAVVEVKGEDGKWKDFEVCDYCGWQETDRNPSGEEK